MSKPIKTSQLNPTNFPCRYVVLNTAAPDVVNYTMSLPPFTGVTRTVQCYENNGHRNFRILTLHIDKDMVIKTEYSDPYAQWEAISRMDLWNANSLMALNDSWFDKKTIWK